MPSYYKLSAVFILRTKPNPLDITIFADAYFIVPGLRALAYLVTTTETNEDLNKLPYNAANSWTLEKEPSTPTYANYVFTFKG
jgi:hypothetical protein